MSAFTTHFSFEFHTGIRDKTQLLMNYLFPIGLYILLGFLMGQLNPIFIKTMIPAFIVIAIMSATVLSLPGPLVSAREAGIFRSYKINGVPASSILAIPALTTAAHMIVVAAIISATAPFCLRCPGARQLGRFCPVLYSGGLRALRARPADKRHLIQLALRGTVVAADFPAVR